MVKSNGAEVVEAARGALEDARRQMKKLVRAADRDLDRAYDALDASMDDDGSYGAAQEAARDEASKAYDAVESLLYRIEDALGCLDEIE